LHSNGYSLVRKIFLEEKKLDLSDHVEELGCTVGEELLRPTKIYAELIQNLIRDFTIKGISNITGGGILENLPRILPQPCTAVIKKGSWESPPVFEYLRKEGKLSDKEMIRTFNNGLGLILVAPEDQADEIVARVGALNESAFTIGEIVERGKDDPSVRIVEEH
jgi:phosphoribosylformylglycinamidine cyclo-ligase